MNDSDDFDEQTVTINPSAAEQELHWADFIGTGFMITGQVFEAFARGFQSIGIDLFKAANYGRAVREQKRYNKRFDVMMGPMHDETPWTIEQFRRPGEES